MRSGRRRVTIALLVLSAHGCLGDPDVDRVEQTSGAEAVLSVRPDAPPGSSPRPGQSSLSRALDRIRGPARVELRPGHYYLSAFPYDDPSCGNCEDPATPVRATVGLRVAGRGIRIVGTSPDDVVIHTRSGYGILFDGCEECSLENVTVTDGIRDADGNATAAAVVVRESTVAIRRCHLRDNIGDPEVVRDVVVGIMGIAGREGSDIVVEGCRIIRNSWDGIALYRGARADIRDNIVDGVDRATGDTVGGGRGVGIGLTWDSRATVKGNLVMRYWKGIGIFVDARATIQENVIENVVTWGIAYWDAGRGRPTAEIQDNAIYDVGACGASLTRGDDKGAAPGRFTGNTIVRSGQNEKYDAPDYYCTQEGLAQMDVPQGFLVQDNLFFDNREAGGKPGRRDLPEDLFLARVRPLLRRLEGRPALIDSRFLANFRANGPKLLEGLEPSEK